MVFWRELDAIGGVPTLCSSKYGAVRRSVRSKAFQCNSSKKRSCGGEVVDDGGSSFGKMAALETALRGPLLDKMFMANDSKTSLAGLGSANRCRKSCSKIAGSCVLSYTSSCDV